MPTPDRMENFGASRVMPEPERAAQIAELRKDLASLVAEVAQVVEARAMQAKDATVEAVDTGLGATRECIRSYPVASIATATVIGAALATLLVPSRPQRSGVARLRAWAPDITRADLREMAGELQRTASRNLNGSSLLPTFERVVDSVSSIDPKTTLTPALEKAGSWLSSLRGGK